MNTIVKYPRTRHIESSGLQKGDDLEIVKFENLIGKTLVVEEKQDGANTAVSFDQNGSILLQSRGHYLTGGDWPEFDQFKMWANTWQDAILDILEDRYIMYGEWMGAFHSVYYDKLPHFFMEFDVFDKKREIFLSTPLRHELLDGKGVQIAHVEVLETREFTDLQDLLSLVGISHFVTEHSAMKIEKAMQEKGFPQDQIDVLMKLNRERLMEGLYLKWEEDGIVKERYKYVRGDFVQTILENGEHWSKRPTIMNELINEDAMYC